MNKPIDPNLDSFDNGLPIIINNEEESDFKGGIKFTDGTAVPKKQEDKKQMALEEQDMQKAHSHHHHHHTHSGDGHSSHGSHHSSHSSKNHKHSHSHHHHHSHGKKKKMPVWLRILIAVIAVITAFAVAVAGTFFVLEQKGKKSVTGNTANVTTQENYEETVTFGGKKYVYNSDIAVLAFLGVDKRELGLENGLVGTAGQADANIVLAINTKTGEAKAIAIPRDTMTEIDIYSDKGKFLRSEQKQLCLSFAYGNGKETSAQNTVTSISRILYNVPINKYFALDLNGIAPINDAIGGVTVTSLYDFKNVNIKKGDTVHLKGDLTETYVRTRDMDNIEASLNRTARQVQYIKAFAAQLAPAVMDDFSVVSRLYNTAMQYSTTNITLSDATYLASLLVSKGVRDFETVTIEGEMKKSEKVENADIVFAEFYPDSDKLMQLVLDTFYTQIG